MRNTRARLCIGWCPESGKSMSLGMGMVTMAVFDDTCGNLIQIYQA